MQSRETPGSRAADEFGELMERVKQRDQAAFSELFERTHRPMHGKVLRIVRDEGTADDVVVEAYTKAWELAARFDTSRGSTRGWLLTIATRLAIDAVRKQVARPGARALDIDGLGETAAPGAGPSEATSEGERRERVQAAVRELPEHQRVAIEAAFYMGLSHSEIAEALGEALGTVKTRIRSGLIALRRSLEPGEVESS